MKDIRLYSILDYYLVLFLMPGVSAVMLGAHFLVDTLVVIIVSSIMFKRFDKLFYGKTIWKVFGLGVAADAIGIIYLNATSWLGYFSIDVFKDTHDSLFEQIMYGLYSAGECDINIYGLINIGIGILVAAVAVFIFDYHIAFRKTDITKKQKIILSLSLAVFTAPYVFFVPIATLKNAFDPIANFFYMY